MSEAGIEQVRLLVSGAGRMLLLPAIGFGAHPASCTVGNGVKGPEEEYELSFVLRVKVHGTSPLLPLYVMMARCL